MSAYVSLSGEQEAVGGERVSGGRLVARLEGLNRLSPRLQSAQVGIHHFYMYSAVLRTLYKMK